MRTGITVTVSPADHDRLSGIVSEGNSPPKHVWRAEIVLLIAEGEGTRAIMSATGKSKTAVWHWQEHFMREGVESLLHDKTRPPGTAPIAKTSTSASAGLRWVLKLISNDWSAMTRHLVILEIPLSTDFSKSSVGRINKVLLIG